MRPRRAFGGLLQTVEQRRPVAVALLQQPHEPRPLSSAHAVVDACADRGVHLSADLRGHLVKGGEPRQLQPGLHHLLQRDVDQIRRTVLRLRLLANRLLDDPPGLGLVVRHADPLADQATVMLGRSSPPGTPAACPPAAPPPAVRSHHHLRDVLQRRETPHTPVRLQHQEQGQQMLTDQPDLGSQGQTPLPLVQMRSDIVNLQRVGKGLLWDRLTKAKRQNTKSKTSILYGFAREDPAESGPQVGPARRANPAADRLRAARCGLGEGLAQVRHLRDALEAKSPRPPNTSTPPRITRLP